MGAAVGTDPDCRPSRWRKRRRSVVRRQGGRAGVDPGVGGGRIDGEAASWRGLVAVAGPVGGPNFEPVGAGAVGRGAGREAGPVELAFEVRARLVGAEAEGGGRVVGRASGAGVDLGFQGAGEVAGEDVLVERFIFSVVSGAHPGDPGAAAAVGGDHRLLLFGRGVGVDSQGGLKGGAAGVEAPQEDAPTRTRFRALPDHGETRRRDRRRSVDEIPIGSSGRLRSRHSARRRRRRSAAREGPCPPRRRRRRRCRRQRSRVRTGPRRGAGATESSPLSGAPEASKRRK